MVIKCCSSSNQYTTPKGVKLSLTKAVIKSQTNYASSLLSPVKAPLEIIKRRFPQVLMTFEIFWIHWHEAWGISNTAKLIMSQIKDVAQRQHAMTFQKISSNSYGLISMVGVDPECVSLI